MSEQTAVEETDATAAARHRVERELRALDETRLSKPELDDIRRRMPRANGDQDTW